MTRPPAAPRPVFFETAAELRRWLEKNHATETELFIGFLKKTPGRSSLTYFEALDEALCFGWIDGVRRSLDAERWCQRFTPRKAKSVWSFVNVRKAEALVAAGRMAPAGLEAFEAREEKRTGLYSFEQGKAPTLGRAELRVFRARPKAWAFFQAQPPGYKRTATFWVVSAKKPETKHRRLRQLIEDSAKGRRLGMLSRPEKKAP